MNEYRFRLAIPAKKYLAYYEGAVQQVVVTLADGQRVQFPADALRRFVTRDGVHGEFVLSVDKQNKLQRIERVGN